MQTTVLVIEDGRVDFETVRVVLSQTMTVQHAGSLADGLALAVSDPPDCVLLDLGLPDSDGVETLTTFVDAHASLPVVVLTGRDDNELGRQVVQLGAQDYLSKGTVHPRLLTRTIRHAIERARINQALEAARAQLVRAQRLDAFGQLASGMAHDFNNLLAVISTTAGLSVQRPGIDPGVSEDLSDILAAAERGRRLVSQLLTFARRRPGKPAVVQVGRQVQALRRILERSIGTSVVLHLEAGEPDPSIRIDPGLLDQVLLNLVVNARDAMPGGGEIRVRSKIGAGDMACLEVEDTGVGMTKEQLRRAIEPFYSTKAGGNGLGLAMCYGIIEQAGGRLELRSTPGEGTRVLIHLPAVAGDVAIDRPRRRRVAPVQLAGARVLLVEDLASLRRVLRRVLRREGVAVLEAGDGHTAMDLIRDEAFDIAILDVTLPMMSGIEIAEALVDLAPGLPVLLMTGGGVPPDELLASNVVEVLEKPFTPETLLQAVDRARGWDGHPEDARGAGDGGS